jgi:hypothetical protein
MRASCVLAQSARRDQPPLGNEVASAGLRRRAGTVHAPRLTERISTHDEVVHGATPYGARALSDECRAVATAPFGRQESTLNAAALRIGTLVAGGAIAEDTARAALLAAAFAMPSQRGWAPWTAEELRRKVLRGLRDGMRRPRQAPPLDGRSPRPWAPARPIPTVVPPAAARDDRRTHDLGFRQWEEAVPIAVTAAEHYILEVRKGALPDDPGVLRFHPCAWRKRDHGPHGPAMLALMTTPAADPRTGYPSPTGVHVTYLQRDGSGKADGPAPKIMLGNAGVIRLTPDEDVTTALGIAEGIETSLGVVRRYDWRPVWAAGSKNGIAKFPVLEAIEALTIWIDADDGGAS